jgi:hypothetical protein
VVGDYFKSKAEALGFADEASDLIAWLHSKTLILALLREVQAAIPGTEGVKAIIRAVLTQWTMHYQAYRRLRELHTVIVMVVEADEKKLGKERYVITGDTRAKVKATQMVKLIKNPRFWDALSVYVIIGTFTVISCLIIGWRLGWNDTSNLSLLRQTLPRRHIAASIPSS